MRPAGHTRRAPTNLRLWGSCDVLMDGQSTGGVDEGDKARAPGTTPRCAVLSVAHRVLRESTFILAGTKS